MSKNKKRLINHLINLEKLKYSNTLNNNIKSLKNEIKTLLSHPSNKALLPQLDIGKISNRLNTQKKNYQIYFGITIFVFIGLMLVFIFSDEKFKPNTPMATTLFGIILLILLLLLIAIIYNYIKIFEISRKKTELIELDAILKSIDENRKQHFLRAYLKKNVLKDE